MNNDNCTSCKNKGQCHILKCKCMLFVAVNFNSFDNIDIGYLYEPPIYPPP